MADRISVDITTAAEVAQPAYAPSTKGRNTCPSCGSHYREEEMVANLRVCTHCGYHFSVTSRERIVQLTDEGSWTEIAAHLRSADPLEFVDSKPYPERLAAAESATGLADAVLVGTATIGDLRVALSVMDFTFMGGSMGAVVGEKFARAADAAVAERIPLVSVSSSGGARMQEGVLALMQMAKTVASVDELREAGLPFISILAHPTTGGVAASFAALGDVIIAEPGALLSFSGPRVVKQTTRESVPDDFGLAESNHRHGHVDVIVPRPELRDMVASAIALLSGGTPYRSRSISPVTPGGMVRAMSDVKRRVGSVFHRRNGDGT